MRTYDARLGRFLSIDPLTKKFPELTPYQFCSNNPIWYIDLDGLEGTQYIKVINQQNNTTTLRVVKDPAALKNEFYLQNINKAGKSTFTKIDPNSKALINEFSEFGLTKPSQSQILKNEIKRKPPLYPILEG